MAYNLSTTLLSAFGSNVIASYTKAPIGLECPTLANSTNKVLAVTIYPDGIPFNFGKMMSKAAMTSVCSAVLYLKLATSIAQSAFILTSLFYNISN